MTSTLRRTTTADPPEAEPTGIYGRQSHAKLKSIAEQLERGHADCAANQWGRPLVYSDDVSASRYGTKPRGGWARIQADIAAGLLRRLWLWESSRGDRKAAEWLDFLDLCASHGVLIHIHTHHRTYDPRVRRDWKTLAEDGIDNEDESRKLSERSRRGTGANAEAGQPWGQVPFGFIRIYHDRTRALIRQAADEVTRVSATGYEWSPAGVVRWMFSEILAGKTLIGIADDLNQRKVPTPRVLAALERGAPKGPEHWATTRWTATVVRRIVLSPGTIGKRVAGGHVVTAGGWDALVDDETYYAVHNIITDPRRKTSRPGKVKHLLSCLAVCEACGTRLTPLAANPKLFKLATYRCGSRRACAGVTQDAADAYVTGWVLRWITAPGRLQALQALEGETNEDAASARAEAERLAADLEQWRAQLDDPDWAGSPTAFARREAALVKAIKAAEDRANASSALATVRLFAGMDEAQATAMWLRLDLAVQRDILRELVTIRLRPVGKGKGQRKDKTVLGERVIITPRIDV